MKSVTVMWSIAVGAVVFCASAATAEEAAAERSFGAAEMRLVNETEMKGRKVLRYEHDSIPEWGYAKTQKDYFYLLPLPGKPENEPLHVVLHSAGHSGDAVLRDAFAHPDWFHYVGLANVQSEEYPGPARAGRFFGTERRLVQRPGGADRYVPKKQVSPGFRLGAVRPQKLSGSIPSRSLGLSLAFDSQERSLSCIFQLQHGQEISRLQERFGRRPRGTDRRPVALDQYQRSRG